MIKKFLASIFIFILSNNALADSTTTFKCNFEDNYEYIINIYTKDINEIRILNMRSKEIYHYDGLKRSADITVIDGNRSYNFKGFKNNSANVEHYLFFTDRANSIFAYLKLIDRDENFNPKTFSITSFDSGIDKITEGLCKVFY